MARIPRRPGPAIQTFFVTKEMLRLGLPWSPWPPMLNNMFFLHTLLDVNTEGGQDLYILKIVIKGGIQGVLVQTSFLYKTQKRSQHLTLNHRVKKFQNLR